MNSTELDMANRGIKVYLDDERVAPEGWVQTYTADQTITLLSCGAVSSLSLDHDLGDDDVIGTGYDVLLWLEERVFGNEYFVPPRTITVHSANVSARTKMELAIEAIQKKSAENADWVREHNS